MMKKILKLIISIFTLSIIINISNENHVYASNYNIHCGDLYEVSYVNDNGGFDKIACYNTFDEANNDMKTKGDDAVVRHYKSLSPTKIIAINQGVAYSYSPRSNSDTLVITQDYAEHKYRKKTYVVKHRELATPITSSYDGDGNGRVDINLTGFDGFVDLKNVDLVPMKYINNQIGIMLGGNTTDEEKEQPFNVVPRQSHYKVEQNGAYTDLVYYIYSGWARNSIPMQTKLIVGPAPDGLEVGQTYYSHDNQNFYSDNKYQNFVLEHYNYYQYIPLRSTSNIGADTYNAYLNRYGYNQKPTSNKINDLSRHASELYNEGSNFIKNQNEYGVNALLTFALAVNESGFGRSYYAVEYKNLFGWNAFDSNPDNASKFPSIDICIRDQMAINFRGYLDIFDSRFFGQHFGNKGSGFNVKYASDPYWGAKAAAIAYEIDKTDNGHDGTLTDYNLHTIGVIDDRVDVNLNKSTNGNTKLFNTEYGSTYHKNYTTVIKEVSDYTKIQIQNALKDNQIYKHAIGGKTQPLYSYNFDRDVGFVTNDKIRIVNGTIVIPPVEDGITPSGDYKFEITNIKLDEQNLSINGLSYQPGIYINNYDDLKHKLILKGTNDTIEIDLINGYEELLNYNFVTFSKSNYDLSVLENDIYEFSINTKHELYEETNIINNKFDKTFDYKHKTYHIYNKDNKLILEVKDKVYKEEFKYHNYYLYNADINDEGKLEIYGFSQLQGLNNDLESTKHQLILININDNKEAKVFDLEFGEPKYDATEATNDGFKYSHSWYKGTIDLSELDYNNYIFNIRTTVDTKVSQLPIYVNNQYEDKELYKVDDTKYYHLFTEYDYSNRLELNITNSSLNINDVNPVSYRKPYSIVKEFNYDEELNQLNISGANFIWSLNSSVDSIGKIILRNKDTGSLYTYDIQFKDTLLANNHFDINDVVRDDRYDYNHSWYDISISMNDIEDGNYELITSITNNETTQFYILDTKIKIKDKDYISNDKLKHFKVTGLDNPKYQLNFDIKGLATEKQIDDELLDIPSLPSTQE